VTSRAPHRPADRPPRRGNCGRTRPELQQSPRLEDVGLHLKLAELTNVDRVLLETQPGCSSKATPRTIGWSDRTLSRRLALCTPALRTSHVTLPLIARASPVMGTATRLRVRRRELTPGDVERTLLVPEQAHASESSAEVSQLLRPSLGFSRQAL
jgi:hypothetical protein